MRKVLLFLFLLPSVAWADIIELNYTGVLMPVAPLQRVPITAQATFDFHGAGEYQAVDWTLYFHTLTLTSNDGPFTATGNAFTLDANGMPLKWYLAAAITSDGLTNSIMTYWQSIGTSEDNALINADIYNCRVGICPHAYVIEWLQSPWVRTDAQAEVQDAPETPSVEMLVFGLIATSLTVWRSHPKCLPRPGRRSTA